MAVVLVVLVAVYSLTLQPEVGGSGDAAKFQFLGYELGTPHATGYPGYLLINYAFTHVVPVGSPAWLANFLSALLAAVACAVVYAVLRVMDIARPVATAVALGLGFTATVWSFATIAEVYSLHLLCCSLILLFMLRWERWRRMGDLYAAFAVLGVALGNHVTVVCWVPAIFLFIAVVDRSILTRPRFLAVVVAFMALGLSQYGYIVWRTFDPDVRFLEVTASDFPELILVMLGGRNQSNLLQLTAGEFIVERVPWIAGSLLSELVLFSPFAIAGLLRRLSKRDCLLLAFAAGNLLFVSIYTVGDLHAYLPPVVLIAMCYAAIGLQRVPAFPSEWGRRMTWAALLLTLGLCLINWRGADRNLDPGPSGYRSVLAAAPDPSLILGMPYGLTMELSYAMLVEQAGGDRRLVRVPLQAPFASFGFEDFRRYLCDGFRFRLPPRGRLVPPELPIVLAGATPPQLDALRKKDYALTTAGNDLAQLTEPSCGNPRQPIAVVVHELEAFPDLGQAITALTDPGFDPTSGAVVIARHEERYDRPPAPAEVLLRQWDDHRALFVVDSAEPGWLVVFDFMPTFWRAWVDGQPVASRPLNIVHRGVEVPAGRHEVLFADTTGSFSVWRWLTNAHPPLHVIGQTDGQ